LFYFVLVMSQTARVVSQFEYLRFFNTLRTAIIRASVVVLTYNWHGACKNQSGTYVLILLVNDTTSDMMRPENGCEIM
jgi:hypothetical protein